MVSRFDLTRAEADLADARGQAENATAAEARTRRLLAGNAVSQASLDQAVAKRDTTQARLSQAEASLQKARDQMGYTELKAEFDGVVTQRLAEVGQVLSAGQGVVTVARPDARDAVVDIPEDLVGAMPADGLFTVSLQSAPEITARGRVRETAPFAETSSRTRRIRMTLEDPNPAFRLGATITVSLSRAKPRSFVLPATALLSEGERRSVWVVADGREIRRPARRHRRAAAGKPGRDCRDGRAATGRARRRGGRPFHPRRAGRAPRHRRRVTVRERVGS